MTQSVRASRGARIDKYEERKRELGRDALNVLSELGYARTSLRDIAKASGFSLGVLHYYFVDKVELISYCVGLYKQDFVEQIQLAVDQASTADSLRTRVFGVLVASVEREPEKHRLWYDIRAQSLFDETFRPAMWRIDRQIESVITAFFVQLADLSGRTAQIGPGSAYAMLDGLFQRYLLRHLNGDARACEDFRHALGQAVDAMMA